MSTDLETSEFQPVILILLLSIRKVLLEELLR